jgi:hypothetical protein
MNGQLPPIDPRLGEQLARRSAGRVPPGLLTDVISELDRTPVWLDRPRVSFAVGHRNWQTAGALAGLAAVVALVAALIAMPALQTGPAALKGYPTDRALTTAELAAVMAGPALATNTALVAEVTIQARTDVCPMDRYPTVGVVEGMRLQVCVMGSGVGAYMNVTQQSGVFAFRYLAPGVLGLVGQVTPASSRLAFHVADDWPLTGKTFVVDAWLGGTPFVQWACPAGGISAGDVLSPNGGECGLESWLADSATPGAIGTLAGKAFANASVDPIALFGDARLVKAGGMRQIDSVDSAPPQHGEYLVRSATGACPADPPTSSRGCPYWLVLAKLAEVSVPTPTSTPTLQVPSGYPIDRALTTSELGRLLDGGSLRQYDTVVVDARVESAPSTCPILDSVYPINLAGVIAGLSPTTCVYSSSASGITPGHLVLRILGARSLGYMGTIAARPTSGGPLAYDAPGSWPADYGFFLVHGWLDTAAWACGRPETLPGFGGPNPVFPVYNNMCHAALTETRYLPPDSATDMTPIPAGPPRIVSFGTPANGRSVDAGPYFTVPATSPSTGSVEGTYLLFTQLHYSVYGKQDPEDYYVLARLTDVVLPAAATTPAPVATPVLEPSPTADTGYPIDRALTTSELGRLLAAGELKQYDTVVVDGADVTASASGACQSPGIPDLEFAGFIAGLDPQVCIYAVPNTPIAEGHMLLRVLKGNTLGYMLSLPDHPPGRSFSPTPAWPDGYFLVHGWLDTVAGDCGRPAAMPTMSGYGLFPDFGKLCHAAITATRFDPATAPVPVITAAGSPGIKSFTIPADGHAVDAGPMFSMPGSAPTSGSIEGTYVVYSSHQCSQYGNNDCESYSVLTRLADVTVPAATPSPPATPIPEVTPSPSTTASGVARTGYPFDRALTTPQLAQVLTSSGNLSTLTLVASVTIESRHDACPFTGLLEAGVLDGMSRQTCVMVGSDTEYLAGATESGTFAFTILEPGYLQLIGEITPASSDQLVFAADGGWPTEGMFLVEGSMDLFANHSCPSGGMSCGFSILRTDVAVTSQDQWPDGTVFVPKVGHMVAGLPFGDNPSGVYLMIAEGFSWPGIASANWGAYARVDDRVAALLPATPSPSPAAGLSPTALWGSGNRPLTLQEMRSLWNAGKLAGRVVVTKGPIPASAACLTPDELTLCNYALAGEGYWVVRFDSAGKPSVLGQLQSASSSFVWTVERVNASTTLKSGDFVAVDGWLAYYGLLCDVVQPGAAPCSPTACRPMRTSVRRRFKFKGWDTRRYSART